MIKVLCLALVLFGIFQCTQQQSINGGPYRNPAVCGIRPYPNRIHGGKEVRIGDWPWQVQLGGCGGVLLNSHWVLTASHCVGDGDRLIVRAGLHNHLKEETWTQRRTVEKVIVHPSPANHPHYNDIALVKVASPFLIDNKFIMPACLSQPIDMIGKTATAVGWGQTDTPSTGIMREVSLTVTMYTWSDLYLCCEVKNEKKGICFGDSGGSFNMKMDDGRYSVVGIAAHLLPGGCAGGGCFTWVGKYLNWIQTTIDQNGPSGIIFGK